MKNWLLAIGYVMGDTVISWIPDFKRIVKAYGGISDSPYKVNFPLIKMSKQGIWNSLPTNYRDHVVWCETPKNSKPCGTCPSCKRVGFIEIETTNPVRKINLNLW